MARIPDPSRLQRAVPSGAQPVYEVGGGELAAGVGEAARTVYGIAAKQKQTDDRYQMSKAGSTFLLNKTKLDGTLAEDPDYATLVDRYSQAGQEQLEQAAEQITDPRARDAFMAEQSVRLQAGIERAREVARTKETDFERAGVESDLAEMRDVIITGNPENQNAGVEMAEERINTAVEMGYMTNEEGGEVLRSFKNSAAEGYIKSLAPADRLEALKSPLAKNLPSDTLAVLQRESESAYEDQQAIDMVDELAMDPEFDTSTWMEKAKTIEDDSLRAKFESRAKLEVAANDRAEIEEQSQLFDEYFLPIRDPNSPMVVDDIPRDVFEAMSPNQQQNLYAAQASKFSRPTITSDPATIDQLHMLNQTKNYPQLRKLFIEAVEENRLSASDVNTWSKISIDGQIPDEYATLLPSQVQLKNKMTAMDISDADAVSIVSEQLTDWHLNTWKQTGRSPTDDQVQRKIDQLIIETRSAPGRMWGTRTMRLYEMDAQQLQEARENMREGNPQMYNAVLATFPAGTQPTDMDFIEAYERATKR